MEKNKDKGIEEVQKLNQISFWLIEQCQKTNAESMEIVQKNVTKHGKNLGDWKIIVEKI